MDEDEVDFKRRRRFKMRPSRSHNEQWMLRYLEHRTILGISDLRGGDSLIDVFLGEERAPVVLDRLRRKGQIRRYWSRRQWHYVICAGAYFAPLLPIVDRADLALRGIPLTRAEIDLMERRTAAQPRNLRLRSVLMDNYERPVKLSRKDTRRYRNHILYMIENIPGHRRLGFRAMQCLEQYPHPQSSAAVARLWRAQIQSNPEALDVLDNAIDYFSYSDNPEATTLLEAALAIEERPEWLAQFGRERASSVFAPDGAPDAAQAALALAAYERAWELTEEHDQSDAAEIAAMALAASDFGKAAHFARWVFSYRTEDDDPERDDESAVHEANIILGRLALRQGDHATAGAYLLAASEIEGSPVYTTGGPRMSLAKELLEAGERGIVLQFLARCARYWNPRFSQVPEWRRAIERGEMPDFGHNARN